MTSHIDSAQALLLGIVQGATEFLPISSSGHLVAIQHFLGLKNPELLFDAILHAGTLLAVLIVYRRDLWEILREGVASCLDILRRRDPRSVWTERPHLRLGVYLVTGTVPAAVVGLLFRDFLEQAFGSLTSVGCMLLVTGLVLFQTRGGAEAGRDLGNLSLRDSFLVGTAQALALLPGISRSGMTIAAGLRCGLDRDLAARYSFLLSVPAILGANILEIGRFLGERGTIDPIPFFVGGTAALVAGYAALRVLLRIVHGGRLFRFAYYCWAMGTALLLSVFVLGSS